MTMTKKRLVILPKSQPQICGIALKTPQAYKHWTTPLTFWQT